MSFSKILLFFLLLVFFQAIKEVTRGMATADTEVSGSVSDNEVYSASIFNLLSTATDNTIVNITNGTT